MELVRTYLAIVSPIFPGTALEKIFQGIPHDHNQLITYSLPIKPEKMKNKDYNKLTDTAKEEIMKIYRTFVEDNSPQVGFIFLRL